MRIFKETLQIKFLERRNLFMGISAVLILASFVAFFVRSGFNYGIDFRGGTIVQVKFQEKMDLGEIRQALADGDLGTFSLQSFGEEGLHEYLITLGRADVTKSLQEEGVATRVANLLRGLGSSPEVRRVESVGPRVGEELKAAAINAILFALLAILLYVWFRFHWRFGVGAILALVHDMLIVLGAFVLTQKEITLPVVAAVLTTAGYSINDTIVIFDRIRENLRRYQKKGTLEIFNESINQTLSRTVLTSGTTLFVVSAIFLFGGEIINDFAFALMIGIVVGTYSSIFIAAPTVYNLGLLFPPKIK